MLCPLLGKVSGYVAHIYSKYTGLGEEFRYFLLFHIVAPPLHNLNKYLAYTPKACVKDECNNAKNSTTFSNYIKNVPIEDDEVMVSFDDISLYMNISIIKTLNIVKDYVYNNDLFMIKMASLNAKFLF